MSVGSDQKILQISMSGSALVLELSRPDQLNGLSEALIDRLQQEMDRVKKDQSVRVVVLKGRGRAFCAGHDLREMNEHIRREANGKSDAAYFQELFKRCSRLMQTLVEVPQPVIAQVEGIATAAGCQLVAQADLAVASTEARFATSGINLGLFCATPSVALTRNLARKFAFEMLMTGEFISAKEALDRGLVNRVVPPDQVDSTVQQLVESIAAKPFDAVAAGKALFYQQEQLSLAAAYQLAGQVMACNIMWPGAQQGIHEFLNKSKP